MDKQIRRLSYVLIALFVLLFAQVNYIQVFANDDLIAHEGNQLRLIVSEYETDRGTIYAADGQTVLAESVETNGQYRYLRKYPRGNTYGHITGYYSLVFGMSLLERSYNDQLGAHDPALLPQNLLDQIVDRPRVGASIVTTIDPKVQEAAVRALRGRPGAIFAMDPQTGEVLALVSVPPYDPNDLSSHDPKEIRRSWERYNRDPQKPMLSKAESELYPPGSTFKIVTAAAALENGYGPNSEWPNPQVLDLPLTDNVLQNFGGSHCAGGAATITLAYAFTTSCDVTFAEIGLKLGAKEMSGQAAAFGFDQDVPFDIPWAEGHFPEPAAFDQNEPLVAYASIGQGDTAANPMQMALVASAIANDGVMMVPRLVTEVRAPDGRVIKEYPAAEWQRSVSSQTAQDLTEMMVSVVDEGTGTEAQIAGVEVAGKTGTAQHQRGEPPHGWFVSFAPADDPQVAVGVVVLNGGGEGGEATGGKIAAPIAKAVMEAAMKGNR